MLGELGEEQTLLQSGVATAEDDDLFGTLVEGAVARGAEVDACADEVLFTFDARTAVGGAGGDQDRTSTDALAGGGDDLGYAPTERLEFGHRDGRQHLDLVAGRLLGESLGELGTLDAFGEPGVVVEALGDAGLAAKCRALDDERAQVLAGAVDGGGETGRPATNDDDVIGVGHRRSREADLLGELLVRRLHQMRTIGENDGRDDLLTVVEILHHLCGGGVDFEVDELEGHALLRQERLGASAVGAPAGAVDDDLIGGHCRLLRDYSM